MSLTHVMDSLLRQLYRGWDVAFGGRWTMTGLRRGMVESFVEQVQANGRLAFHEAEIVDHSHAPKAVSEALRRLQLAGKVRRILRKSDFFVIVQQEFRAM